MGPPYRLILPNIDTTIRSIQEIGGSGRPAITGTKRVGQSVNESTDMYGGDQKLLEEQVSS